MSVESSGKLDHVTVKLYSGPWDGLEVEGVASLEERFVEVELHDGEWLSEDIQTGVMRLVYGHRDDSRPDGVGLFECWYVQNPAKPTDWLYMQYEGACEDDEDAA